MLRWEQTEFLLKGLYLGVLLMVAWQLPTPEEAYLIGGCTVGGLAVFLGAAAWRKVREGYTPHGRMLGFLLFLILDNPRTVFAGLMIGLCGGTYLAFRERQPPLDWDSLAFLGAGAALGVIFYLLRTVRDRKQRNRLAFGLAVALIGGTAGAYYYALEYRPELLRNDQLQMFGILLLAGLPGFYLLTFASLVEESEVEIAAMCAALGIGSWLLILPHDFSPVFKSLILALPLAIYYVYSRQVLPGLRVFKHALRGMSYRQVGNTRLALVSLGRALQLNPTHALAREQLWQIHRELDIDHLTSHPDILELINFNMCLERVASLLLQDRPRPEHLQEAHRLLDLIASQQPAMAPCSDYWRAVAFCHQRLYDDAAKHLEAVVKPTDQDSEYRQAVLFAAWQLALVLHPEMIRRVGEPLLKQPGNRMQAIAGVERQLSQSPKDEGAWALKRILYSEMTESEYAAAVPPGKATTHFDYAYTRELGVALIDDPKRWARGCEYLRLAARGLPAAAPGIYIQIAQAHEKHGDKTGMWENYQRAMQIGRNVGVASLPAEERAALFAVVKMVGDNAIADNRIDAALDAFKFYSQKEDAGIETYRMLAELFEKKQDFWMALHCTAHALTYNESDPDLTERRDRYYYNIMPGDLAQRLDQVQSWFDTTYCVEKARYLLEHYNGEYDLLDWAAHLTDLARVASPAAITPRFLRARVHRVKGEIPETIAVLEEIRQNRPAKFATNDDQSAWYLAHRLLGDLYLDTKPDQAVLCFHEFRKSTELSGADTMYKLGRAYENLGDFVRAARCYEEVTGFEQHPLYYEARDGLDRVRARR